MNARVVELVIRCQRRLPEAGTYIVSFTSGRTDRIRILDVVQRPPAGVRRNRHHKARHGLNARIINLFSQYLLYICLFNNGLSLLVIYKNLSSYAKKCAKRTDAHYAIRGKGKLSRTTFTVLFVGVENSSRQKTKIFIIVRVICYR